MYCYVAGGALCRSLASTAPRGRKILRLGSVFGLVCRYLAQQRPFRAAGQNSVGWMGSYRLALPSRSRTPRGLWLLVPSGLDGLDGLGAL